MAADSQSGPFRFTDEESFGLFLEGLRSLQHYEDEAAKEHPCQADLTRWMQGALDRLRECTSRFPFDPLPRFYLGVALTTRNQEVYVQRLVQFKAALLAFGRLLWFKDNEAAAHSETEKKFFRDHVRVEQGRHRAYLDLDQLPWPLLEEATRVFKRLRRHGNPKTLRRVARYNLAVVYARRGGKKFLTKGINALGRVNDLDLGELTRRVREARRRIQAIPQATWKGQWLPWKKNKRDRRIRAEERHLLALNEKVAVAIQFDSLRASLDLRLATIDDGADFFDARAYQSKINRLEVVRLEIEHTHILDPSFKVDLRADFLTQSGYKDFELTSKRRLLQNKQIADALASPPDPLGKDLPADAVRSPIEDGPVNAEYFLRRAARSFFSALEIKEQWNPAQIYLALVRRIQSGMADAKSDYLRFQKKDALGGHEEAMARLAKEIAIARQELAKSGREIVTATGRGPQSEPSVAEAASSEEPEEIKEKRQRLEDITENSQAVSSLLDPDIEESDREKKQMASDSDELFASLQGLPWPPPPKPPDFGDG